MMSNAYGCSRPPMLAIPPAEDFGDFELAPRAEHSDVCQASKPTTPRSPTSGGSQTSKASVVGCRSGPGSAGSPGLRLGPSLAKVKVLFSSSTRSIDLTDDPDSQSESPFLLAGGTS